MLGVLPWNCEALHASCRRLLCFCRQRRELLAKASWRARGAAAGRDQQKPSSSCEGALLLQASCSPQSLLLLSLPTCRGQRDLQTVWRGERDGVDVPPYGADPSLPDPASRPRLAAFVRLFEGFGNSFSDQFWLRKRAQTNSRMF